MTRLAENQNQKWRRCTWCCVVDLDLGTPQSGGSSYGGHSNLSFYVGVVPDKPQKDKIFHFTWHGFPHSMAIRPVKRRM